MELCFDEVKATQAAARFLRVSGRPIQYLALIKLLYKADREAIRRFGLPITTDKYVSMKLGPVTSNIYNRIKASADPTSHPTFWSAHIRRGGDPLFLELHLDPGDSELSLAEERLIDEIFAEDGAKDGFELAEECLRNFPEWKDPGSSSFPLPVEDIVAALGLSEDEAANIEKLFEKQKAAMSLAT
jgi:hypothetical protein